MNAPISSVISGNRGPGLETLGRRAVAAPATPPTLTVGPRANSALQRSFRSLPRNVNAGCDTTSCQLPPACRRARVGIALVSLCTERLAARSKPVALKTRDGVDAIKPATCAAPCVASCRTWACVAMSIQVSPACRSAVTMANAVVVGDSPFALRWAFRTAAASSSHKCRSSSKPSACMLRRRWSPRACFAPFVCVSTPGRS
mmetsp:Transcript_3357/g.12485  ORF Transcript_3357/g.12485 Transcript_3357/m.12485 type:complete len:202 (-) Transcript_3357:314-919(-)